MAGSAPLSRANANPAGPARRLETGHPATSRPLEADARAPHRASNPIPVAVLPPLISGKVGVSAKEILEDRLALGLKAAGASVITGAQLHKAYGRQKGPCDRNCVIRLGKVTRSDFVAGATIKAEHPFYDLHLWIADAKQGKVLATVSENCEVCPPAALGRKIDLAASKLASRLTELASSPAELLITSDPDGATIFIDGTERGKAPLEVKLAPGRHQLLAQAPGHVATQRKLRVIGGVAEKVSLSLLPEAARRISPTRRVVAWSALGVGIASTVAGIALIALDGQGGDCVQGALGSERCANTRNSLALGAVFSVLGAATLATGAYLLLSGSGTPGEHAKAVSEGTRADSSAQGQGSPRAFQIGPGGIRVRF